MDRFFLSLKANVLIAIVAVLAAFSWVSLCQKYYESYWLGTIRRVQTVDFNILHHTMPITLSYLILSGRSEAIQQVLDSNYGIFGIVITDPRGANVVYKSEKIYKFKSWQNDLGMKVLAASQQGLDAEHFDWLTDPPPDHAQYENATPRTPADRQVAPPPKGQIIGRVYYLRQPPPPFWSDVAGAFSGNWLEMTGSKRGYVLQTLNVLSFSLLIVLVILWRKQVLEGQEHDLAQLEKELAIKRRALETLTNDLSSQRQRKQWLEQEADRAYKHAVRLKQSLEKLKDAFFFVDPHLGESQAVSKIGELKVRAPGSPPSAVIEEIEELLPDLTNNAKILKSQAEVLQTYCTQLEKRQTEMQQILERTKTTRSSSQAPAAAHVLSPFVSDKTSP
jgi:hypothetical protein